MVDRVAVAVDRTKHHRLEVEVGAEALQRHLVGAVRPGRIGHATDMVEHHGAGAFKIDAVLFEA